MKKFCILLVSTCTPLRIGYFDTDRTRDEDLVTEIQSVIKMITCYYPSMSLGVDILNPTERNQQMILRCLVKEPQSCGKNQSKYVNLLHGEQ